MSTFHRLRVRYVSTLVPVLILCICTGCHTTSEQIGAVESSVKNKLIRGLDPDTQMACVSWRWPTRFGPYDQIDALPANLESGKQKGHEVIFFLGRRTGDGKWEVFAAMLEEGRRGWWMLPVLPASSHELNWDGAHAWDDADRKPQAGSEPTPPAKEDQPR